MQLDGPIHVRGPKHVRGHRLALAALLPLLVLPACGSSAKKSTLPASSGPTIHIKDFQFGAPSASVHAGDTVTVVNDDGTTHTLSQTGSGFDAGRIGGGASGSFVAPAAGTYTFMCHIHSSMKGTLTVS